MAFVSASRKIVILGLVFTFIVLLISGAAYRHPDKFDISHVNDRVHEILHPIVDESKDEPEAKEQLIPTPVPEPHDEPVVEEPSSKPVEEPSSKPAEEPSSKPVEEPGSKPEEEPSSTPEPKPTRLPEYVAGLNQVGKHVHVRPSPPTPKDQGFAGCNYPIVIHVSPDAHCTGVLALYGSVVRNVLLQPEKLKGHTCVHVTFADPNLETIEEMYRWVPQKNPYTHVHDCALLDTTPALNDVVPIRFQALPVIEKPKIMQAGLATWAVALNKVHSWGLDLYPQILILDADSFIITDLDKIFDESSSEVTISAAPDQFKNCGDRGRINGGMILLRPSRYFHISALELVYDEAGSCASGKWQQSEQELLNCICGAQGPARGSRPEFTCNIMPLYNSVWPRNFGCSAANVVPIRSIHITANTKPWLVDDNRLHERFDYAFWGCVRDASRNNDVAALQKCDVPPLEETRLVTNELPPSGV
ncbi:uncharacterized protein L3040_007100 [Drepanopeziza brunnea f. sp. 'multigermtubi']|uniref:uncharacterized protein n=1 Tax=Drepanopeziza brunnea f. sp. 'multigermtubi' TaxID=698441 RepID=UPI00238E6120|nr:hypothetical protein L3040_007100 [Drepanopeziza brunnea f. sp. 'multigermtubi']